MSQENIEVENVELPRRFFYAYNRGDLQTTLDLLAPEFEFRPSGLFMDTETTYRGREGWSEFWHTFRAAWESVARSRSSGSKISVSRCSSLAPSVGRATEAVSR